MPGTYRVRIDADEITTSARSMRLELPDRIYYVEILHARPRTHRRQQSWRGYDVVDGVGKLNWQDSEGRLCSTDELVITAPCDIQLIVYSEEDVFEEETDDSSGSDFPDFRVELEKVTAARVP